MYELKIIGITLLVVIYVIVAMYLLLNWDRGKTLGGKSINLLSVFFWPIFILYLLTIHRLYIFYVRRLSIYVDFFMLHFFNKKIKVHYGVIKRLYNKELNINRIDKKWRLKIIEIIAKQANIDVTGEFNQFEL